MSLNNFTHQTIALAGIAQSAALVDQLATTGAVDSVAFKASIGSLLKIDAASVMDVYGGLSGLKLGLERLQYQMSGSDTHSEQARYAAGLVFLERKFSEQPQMQKKVRASIQKAQAQAEYFDVLHDNVLANLGDIYSTTLSTLQPRIMVHGEECYLSHPDTVNKIRAVLLAGIRSALLWRQCGGTRWKFLFYRNKLQQETKILLTQV
jgi:high frequency lysogenization protein